MSNIETGGPAFPLHAATPVDSLSEMKGMTLRDYLAAHAITAAAEDELRHPTFDEATYKGTATRAYLYADAMLKARES